MGEAETRRRIEAVWRIESARLLGGLIRLLGEVELAEEVAQDALVSALERWPASGVPPNPGAWLMATARNRAVDVLRRRARFGRKRDELAHELALEGEGVEHDPAEAAESGVDDDVLRLIFIACHPVLTREARIALTLRLVAGLTTEEIARAFLVAEPTVAQRLVRAKRTLREARVPFELPVGPELRARLASALEVVYLVFNEGYAATRGESWMRLALLDEALRLGRILATLLPDEPEALALLALMELQAARNAARVDADGAPILLMEQDRSRWDPLLIRRGLAALQRAQALGGGLGSYALQAAIAACHARARTPEETDWECIVALYDALAQIAPSPVVELNRAVAVSMAFGAEAALELLGDLLREPALARYHLLPAVHADLLLRLGRRVEARAEFERAASLATNSREQALLLARAARCVIAVVAS